MASLCSVASGRNAAKHEIEHRVVFGFSLHTAPTLMDFLRRHRNELSHATGIRYSGELGHPFHVIDERTVMLPLDHPFVPEGRFASMLVVAPGGETFLASLALALGLVELAGRGGGRFDSLILDEGFASLDSAALTCALDELERRAASGKLVALVSHLDALADMAPEVLYILQQDGSSVARWRNLLTGWYAR